jgi:peroxiredoxin
VLLASCAGAHKPAPSGRAGADFALHDLDGRTVRLSDHRGKVVLLNFWATWCRPCASELPHLQRLHEKYRDQGLVILGISIDGPDSAANVGSEIKQAGVQYPILLDEETHVVGTYDPKGTAPFTVFIDRDGVAVGTREGYSAGDEVALEAEVVSLLAATERAEVAPVTVTSTTTASLRAGDDRYGELFEKLNIGAAIESWQIAARADTATFVSEPAPEIVDRYTVEKSSVAHAWRSLDVTVGDAYVSFGRGLALSLRKVDELGIDTTLRGAKIQVRHRQFEGTVAAGYANINNVDEATSRSIADPYDLIGGALAQVRLDGRYLVGVYGSAVAFHDALGLAMRDAYSDRIVQAGALVDAPRIVEAIGLYLEGMVQKVATDPAPEDPLAYAFYGTVTASRGRTTLLLEGKAYGSLTALNPRLDNPFESIAYNNPPTVERTLQQLENPQRNTAGGRARIDVRLTPGVLVYANDGVFRDWLGYADPNEVGKIANATAHDSYAGFEARWNGERSWAITEAGYRLVVVDGSHDLVRGDGHIELDVAQAISPGLSLTLHGRHLERKKVVSPILSEAFREGSVDAGIRARPWLAVSGGYDYTTEPTQPKRDYFHANVAWDITPSSSLRLFAGSARGGLRCVSGVCRAFPPFEGVKLTLTVRY